MRVVIFYTLAGPVLPARSTRRGHGQRARDDSQQHTAAATDGRASARRRLAIARSSRTHAVLRCYFACARAAIDPFREGGLPGVQCQRPLARKCDTAFDRRRTTFEPVAGARQWRALAGTCNAKTTATHGTGSVDTMSLHRMRVHQEPRSMLSAVMPATGCCHAGRQPPIAVSSFGGGSKAGAPARWRDRVARARCHDGARPAACAAGLAVGWSQV